MPSLCSGSASHLSVLHGHSRRHWNVHSFSVTFNLAIETVSLYQCKVVRRLSHSVYIMTSFRLKSNKSSSPRCMRKIQFFHVSLTGFDETPDVQITKCMRCQTKFDLLSMFAAGIYIDWMLVIHLSTNVMHILRSVAFHSNHQHHGF